MKTEYSRDDINSFVRGLDVRAKSLSDAKLTDVVNRGYAELLTVSTRLFSNEDIISLDEYYEASELVLTFDVEDDAVEVYDLYLTVEGDDADKSYCDEVVQGVGIFRNNDVAYRDNRYIGRIHLDLDYDKNNSKHFDNCVIKYYYTPKATDDSIMMSSQVWATFTDAMWASLNYFLKDVTSESQKRASMERTSKAVIEVYPEDIPERGRAVFGGM